MRKEEEEEEEGVSVEYFHTPGCSLQTALDKPQSKPKTCTCTHTHILHFHRPSPSLGVWTASRQAGRHSGPLFDIATHRS